MELVVRKTDLLRELQLFQGIVERTNTIPILANVLIEAAGEQVKLLATALEVPVSALVDQPTTAPPPEPDDVSALRASVFDLAAAISDAITDWREAH